MSPTSFLKVATFVSFFLYLAAKLRRKGEMCKSFSVLFVSFDTIIELLYKKRYADLYNWGIDWPFMLMIFVIGRIDYIIFCRLLYIDYICGKIRILSDKNDRTVTK